MEIEIRQLTTGDARQLVQCFERCYGNTYPNETFYDPAAIAGLISSGKLRSIVAAADNHIIGHTGLMVRNADASVTEAGNTVVDPDWRGRGILARLGHSLAKLCKELGFVGYVHYPTTAHEVMQRRSVADGGVETGVMLGYIPADTDYREIDQECGRIAATIVYQPFAPSPPLNVFVPERYAALLSSLYGRAGLTRDSSIATPSSPSQTRVSFTHSLRRSLLNVQVRQAGKDIAEVARRLMIANPADITHIDFNLDEPSINQAVEELVNLEFCYCGLLPGFARSDVLRLQHLRNRTTGLMAPALVNAGAKRLLALVNAESDYSGAGSNKRCSC